MLLTDTTELYTEKKGLDPSQFIGFSCFAADKQLTL